MARDKLKQKLKHDDQKEKVNDYKKLKQLHRELRKEKKNYLNILKDTQDEV